MFILPVQFPLHEPYFDLTPIKVLHTKTILHIYITLIYITLHRIYQTYCIFFFQRLTSG